MNDRTVHSDRLSAEERKELKDSDFGIPETREFPIPDAPCQGCRGLFQICP